LLLLSLNETAPLCFRFGFNYQFQISNEKIIYMLWSCDSSVRIGIRLQSVQSMYHGLILGRQEAIFFLKTSRSSLGFTHISTQWALWDIASGAKQPRLEADHSSLSNVKIKNAWSYSFSFPYSYMLWTCEFSLYFCTRRRQTDLTNTDDRVDVDLLQQKFYLFIFVVKWT
jgi:hypothetical protein